MRVDELKNKILQLAIQGKLVPQDPNDESASVLLERIKEEKKQLIKEKKIKKEKPLPEISEEEKVFDIPKGWEWCRLGEIGSYKKGPFGSTITKSMFVPKSENTIKVYEQKNAINKNWNLGDYYVTKEYFESKLKGFEVFEGDIIVSCAGTIGETYIMPKGIERGVINQALMKMNIFDGINIDYFLIYFESILKITAKESSKGSAIKNIPPFDIFKKMLFALPPLQEQKRIVSKIDELFSIIDKLSENKESLSKNIDITRDKVLQLAIQGKLVPQDPDDEPASVLLEKIKKEKEQLIKEKKIKKEKPLPEISEEEKSFEIPKGWEWIRLGDFIRFIGGSQPPKSTFKYEYHEGYVRLIQIRDYKSDSHITYIPIDKAKKFCNKDEIMIGRYGPPIFQILRGIDGAYNVALMKADPIDGITTDYLYYLLKDPILLRNLEYVSSRTCGQDGIDMDTLRKYLVALPPLQEQKRIVAKIDEIMSYLDKLQDLIDGKSLEIEGIQVKEIALSKDEELLQK